jgi:hypothetical protein
VVCVGHHHPRRQAPHVNSPRCLAGGGSDGEGTAYATSCARSMALLARGARVRRWVASDAEPRFRQACAQLQAHEAALDEQHTLVSSLASPDHLCTPAQNFPHLALSLLPRQRRLTGS